MHQEAQRGEVQTVHITLQIDGKKHKITGRDVRLVVEPEPAVQAAGPGAMLRESIRICDGVLTTITTITSGATITSTTTTTDTSTGQQESTTTTSDPCATIGG